METKDAALLVRLRELFALEADEHLQAITTGLLELEKHPDEARSTELIEAVYRAVHTLKGAARAVNLVEIETVCQVTESVCAALKRKEFEVWPECFDTLHRAMDVVRELRATPEGASGGRTVELVKELEQLETQGRARTAEHIPAPAVIRQPVEAPSYEQESPPEAPQEELPPQAEPWEMQASQEPEVSSAGEVTLTATVDTSEPDTKKKPSPTATTLRKAAAKKPRASRKKTAAAETENGGTDETAPARKKTKKQETVNILPEFLTSSEPQELSPFASFSEGQTRASQEPVLSPQESTVLLEPAPTPQETPRREEESFTTAEEPVIEEPAQREMLARLRGIFAIEAEDYLQTITNTLLALEREQDQGKEKALLETLFRCMHSLKGAARAVNFREVEGVCQILENVCASLKRKEFAGWPEFFDSFHRVMDAVRLLSTVSEGHTKPQVTEIVAEATRLEAQGRERVGKTQTTVAPPAYVARVVPTPVKNGHASQPEQLERAPVPAPTQDEPRLMEEEESTLPLERVRELFDPPPSMSATTKAGVTVASPVSEKNASPQGKGQGGRKTLSSANVVRVEAAKLDSLFLQAEEMLAVKLKTNVHTTELHGLTVMLEAWKREWARVHTDIRKTQRILEKEENRSSHDPLYEQAAKLVEFLDWTHGHVKTVDKALTKVAKVMLRDQRSLSNMVDILLEEAKKVLMLPFSSALEVLPKMVRDLSRTQGKEVEFALQGGEVEVDKRILEEIKDPLIHLLRNCIDHGIESPIERERKQKPRQGSIAIAISPGDGNSVEIVVQDTGGGIDAAKVRNAAVKSGILPRDVADRLPDHEAILLIFQSEVSTSETVSDISGRGLGMAIVREKVEKLGGQIAVETRLHQGTTFRIRLPLTLATFRGVLVQAAGQTFVVPTVNIERVVRVPRDAIQTTGSNETLSVAGYTLPLFQLERAIGLATKTRNEERGRAQLALVLGQGEHQVAFGIDAVISEQEVLFKGLGPQLVRVRNIAGATVLGSGQVASVLNVKDLLTSVNGTALPFSQMMEEATTEEFQKKAILVAEDSITSRMLLKEILESAGYTVLTAIDGEDAFSSLEKTSFDLVVSDVEMPRMNGFDLASKIRGDDRYSHLPVVLVTGLESPTDRERGVAVGASAYVVKGSFDQSNLLETIRQFL